MDDLKISKAPKAFAEFARKHNALVDLLMTMKGEGGVKVTASNSNVIIDGFGVAGDGSDGDAVNTVGADGKLVAVVKHATAVTPVTYPTALGVVTASVTALINSTGFTMTNASSKSFTVAFAALTYDMSVREIEICDAGATKKMLIVGSAPY